METVEKYSELIGKIINNDIDDSKTNYVIEDVVKITDQKSGLCLLRKDKKPLLKLWNTDIDTLIEKGSIVAEGATWYISISKGDIATEKFEADLKDLSLEFEEIDVEAKTFEEMEDQYQSGDSENQANVKEVYLSFDEEKKARFINHMFRAAEIDMGLDPDIREVLSEEYVKKEFECALGIAGYEEQEEEPDRTGENEIYAMAGAMSQDEWRLILNTLKLSPTVTDITDSLEQFKYKLNMKLEIIDKITKFLA